MIPAYSSFSTNLSWSHTNSSCSLMAVKSAALKTFSVDWGGREEGRDRRREGEREGERERGGDIITHTLQYDQDWHCRPSGGNETVRSYYSYPIRTCSPKLSVNPSLTGYIIKRYRLHICTLHIGTRSCYINSCTPVTLVLNFNQCFTLVCTVNLTLSCSLRASDISTCRDVSSSRSTVPERALGLGCSSTSSLPAPCWAGWSSLPSCDGEIWEDSIIPS